MPGTRSRQTAPLIEPTLAELQRVRAELQQLLNQHNPGEELSWPVPAQPLEIPAHTLSTIEAAGPAMHGFFAAANAIFREVPWVRPLVEKRYHPNYRRLNDAQGEALPWNPRPDVVPDRDWNPKFVELEITVGGRSDGSMMSRVYGMPAEATTVYQYAEMLRRRGLTEQPVVLISAYHPAYEDLGNDARCFASLCREAGANVIALGDEDLPYLSYRDGRLRYVRPGAAFEFTHFDRFIDIFEIAEVAHAGMRPLLDAYLDGAATDLNTCKQFLDEKLWMALFWDPRLESVWRRHVDASHVELLRRILPFTTFLTADTQVRFGRQWLPIGKLRDLKDHERTFVTKESGTSETAAAAQSFVVLSEMSGPDADAHLKRVIEQGPPSVIQELVESAKIDFHAIDPDTNARMQQEQARVKMSAFYVDGRLGDLLLIASNKQYAVHNGDYMETVVARPGVGNAG
jgi:hypothetical protein